MPTFTAVVPAAGRGSRMQSKIPKQHLMLGEKTILEHTLMRLLAHPAIEKVVVVVSESDEQFAELSIMHDPRIVVTTGGAERSMSVLNGLACVETEWVLVHDAARPCITASDLDKLFEVAIKQDDGAILASPVKDTMKRSDHQQQITETVSRSQLWHALTPQMFPTQLLTDAIDSGLSQGMVLTDEASAMEIAGYHPKLVAGRADNIKVTLPEDLALAEFILKQQESV